jgi:hypothetical protein
LFTGVVDIGEKFIIGVAVTGSFFSGVNDTGDKFIAGINFTAHQRNSVTKINRQCQRHRR